MILTASDREDLDSKGNELLDHSCPCIVHNTSSITTAMLPLAQTRSARLLQKDRILGGDTLLESRRRLKANIFNSFDLQRRAIVTSTLRWVAR